jgi:hypothetical protein
MAAKLEKWPRAGRLRSARLQSAIKVTARQTILFLAGQVPYEMDGTVKHRGDFGVGADRVRRRQGVVEAPAAALPTS